VIPPNGRENNAVFVATNFGFYVSFLSEALGGMRRQINAVSPAHKVPCIATVTNHLPTHFWTNPHDLDDKYLLRHADSDLDRYRRSLHDFVTNKLFPGRVFRAVLVAEENDPKLNRIASAECPLWPAIQWEWEREWVLAASEDGRLLWSTAQNGGAVNSGQIDGRWILIREFLRHKAFEELGFRERKTNNATVTKKIEEPVPLSRFQIIRPSLSHWKKKREEGLRKGETGPFVFCEEEGRVVAAPAFQSEFEGLMSSKWQREGRFGDSFVNIRQRFQQEMHPKRDSGCTLVLKCPEDDFTKKFQGRPDVLFLGCCDRGTNAETKEFWTSDDKAFHLEWSLAMMATMSPKSQTMFLTVLYDEASINALWQSTKRGVGDLMQAKRRIDAISSPG
jgi:hypothetical protein